jgi:hypothetical protein
MLMIKYILILHMLNGYPDFIVPKLFHDLEQCERLAASVKATAAKVVPPTTDTITHVCYKIVDGD